ncbi:Gamma-aminobutyraldehyde dehydrogenase [Pseudomonas fluorescens]|uniref:Gamma-aminobutyraldehyde dehydrogenase n=1 Tax=Pseudomonas fluorescens TaxID=294 RepID=A0A5E7SX80_PSEFL|nr:Gamma-aminobutyraldehyde dehydrogenase [Pseudomonas fluorescens]
MHIKMLINGELVAGEGERLAVMNPSLGTALVDIAEATPAQVDCAVQAADAAFESWSQTTPKHRSLLLLKLADLIDSHAVELARLESNNCGKPYAAVC